MRQILSNRNRINEWLLCLYVFCLSWLQQGAIIAIVLLALNVLTSINFKNMLTNIFKQKIYLFLLLFYFIHVFGLLYTENYNYAFFDLGIKVSFLVVPILFSGLLIGPETSTRIKLSFIAGCLVSIFISLFHSIYLYSEEHWINDFFYEKFAWFNHPTYITIYVNLALLFLLEYLFVRWNEVSPSKKTVLIFIGYLFVAAIIMYSSRTGTAVSGFTLLIYLGISLKKYFRGYLISTIVIVSVVATAGIMYSLSLSFFDRYSELQVEMKEEVKKFSNNIVSPDNTNSANSASSRVLVWRYSWELIQENWLLGIGTGDIKDELVERSKEHNWKYGIERNLNPHNQFLHTWLTVGTLGVILLLLNFLFPLLFSIKRRHWIYTSFLIIVILNCITESILEVQRGVLLFPFFTCLLYNISNYEKSGS